MAKISIKINTDKKTIPELEQELSLLEKNADIVRNIIKLKKIQFENESKN